MDLDELLGIDPDDPLQAAALEQVEIDAALFADLKRLRDARRPRLTQAEVARRMDVDQSTVARIESGRRDVRLSTLRAYALALHARVEHVVVDIEDPQTRLPASGGATSRYWDFAGGISFGAGEALRVITLQHFPPPKPEITAHGPVGDHWVSFGALRMKEVHP